MRRGSRTDKYGGGNNLGLGKGLITVMPLKAGSCLIFFQFPGNAGRARV